MLNIVLHQPQIAPNTGNIIRLSANTGATLHLIKPLGFSISDKKVRRAGLDYHDISSLILHESLEEFLQNASRKHIFAFSTQGQTNMFQANFVRNSFLIFGSETRGLPKSFLTDLNPRNSLRIPMVKTSRCLNLSNAVAVGVFEAWRQIAFEGST
jgi:tRNA (cytidine/uridine-2'-O-)-methyltransferase